jgi:hypothetical protein
MAKGRSEIHSDSNTHELATAMRIFTPLRQLTKYFSNSQPKMRDDAPESINSDSIASMPDARSAHASIDVFSTIHASSTELAPFCCLLAGVRFGIIGWTARGACPCREPPEFDGFKEFAVALAVRAEEACADDATGLLEDDDPAF